MNNITILSYQYNSSPNMTYSRSHRCNKSVKGTFMDSVTSCRPV